MTTVVFETHSTSEHNEAGIATGWLGGALSATGRAQAVELGERRRDDGLEVVVASDLWRAVETAAIAFQGSRIPLLVDWRLRECDYGELNGMPRTLLDEQRARRIDEPWPGGESWRDAVARVSSFLDEVRGGRVLADRPRGDALGARAPREPPDARGARSRRVRLAAGLGVRTVSALRPEQLP